MTWDPDLDLEHGVLRNRLKITDPQAPAAAEAAATTLRIREVVARPIPGCYDLPHLQHRTFPAQLVGEAGWCLAWDGLDRERNRTAARAAYDGDPAPRRALSTSASAARGEGRERSL